MKEKFDKGYTVMLRIIKKKEFNINTSENKKIGMTFEFLAGFIAYSRAHTHTHIIE